jgi:hypothetical protein
MRGSQHRKDRLDEPLPKRKGRLEARDALDDGTVIHFMLKGALILSRIFSLLSPFPGEQTRGGMSWAKGDSGVIRGREELFIQV